MMISEAALITATPDQISAELSGEAVILNLKSGVYYGLNDVGARIWDLLQQPKTLKQLQEILLDEYDIDSEVCNRDLQAILQEMAAVELVKID
jgi:hypothetical protein